MYYQSIIQTLRIIRVKCIPLRLRSKTSQRATHLLPISIHSCMRGTFICVLPFTTNVTISTSILHTFRSVLVAFCAVMLLFGFPCGCRGFCRRTDSDFFLSLREATVEGSSALLWSHRVRLPSVLNFSHFRLLKPLNRICLILTGSKNSTFSTKFTFFEPIKNHDGRPG